MTLTARDAGRALIREGADRREHAGVVDEQYALRAVHEAMQCVACQPCGERGQIGEVEFDSVQRVGMACGERSIAFARNGEHIDALPEQDFRERGAEAASVAGDDGANLLRHGA